MRHPFGPSVAAVSDLLLEIAEWLGHQPRSGSRINELAAS